MTTLYKNRVWLANRYVIKGKTAKEIAEECSVDEATIWRWLKKYDLMRKSRNLK